MTRGGRRRARRPVAPRHHVHRARGGRASRPHPRRGSSSAAVRTWRSSSTAPGSRRSTASAGACSARTRWRRASTPRFRVLDEPQALVLQAEAFSVALERFCAADEPDRWQLLATYGAAGLRQHARRGLRDAALGGPRPRPRARARRRRSPSGSRRCARRRAASSRTSARPRHSTPPRTRRSSSSPRRPCPSGCSRSRPEGARAARRRVRRGARRSRRRGARGARDARPRAPPGAPDRRSRWRTREAKERESALDFEDLQLRVRDLLRDDPVIRERERERFRSIMVDEFQDTNRAPDRAARPARRRRGGRATSSSSATSSSRSTGSGTRTSPSSGSAGRPHRPSCR